MKISATLTLVFVILDVSLARMYPRAKWPRARSGSLENISHHFGAKGFRFVRGDIRDAHVVEDLVSRVDYVVHLAALVSVPESLRDPALTYDINVNGTLSLLKASVDYGVERFVYASSCAVYGNAEKLPIKEDCPAKPMSPYGISKLTAENYVRKYFEDFGLETVCLRYFNVYGPRQAHSDYSGVITQFIKRVKEDLPLVIFGDGEQTRDFVYVEDVAEANLLTLKCKNIAGEVFNIGTGVATSINQLANMLLEIANKRDARALDLEKQGIWRSADCLQEVGCLLIQALSLVDIALVLSALILGRLPSCGDWICCLPRL
jgi:UDP-glucose 4-epimerase